MSEAGGYRQAAEQRGISVEHYEAQASAAAEATALSALTSIEAEVVEAVHAASRGEDGADERLWALIGEAVEAGLAVARDEFDLNVEQANVAIEAKARSPRTSGP